MISHATIIGRSHRLMQQNCHDFAITGTPAPDCVFGLVLDGCGSKHRKETGTYPSHNEVGAKLLGQFTAVYLATQLPHHDLDKIFFANLYSTCCHYLQNLVALLPTTNPILQNRFIASHLLSTLLGFVVKEETAVFFWSGDGYLVHNGEVTHLDNHNQPDYLAYQLRKTAEPLNLQSPETPKWPNGPISQPPTFHTHTIHNPDLLAVASDGWTADLLSQLDTPQPPLALQRWLNIRAKKHSTFEDDGAIAIWWQEEPAMSEP